MRNRIIAYLLIALFAAFAWLHVMIAREHAAAAQAYADATEVMYAARVQNLQAHFTLTQALATYRDALAVCGRTGGRLQGTGDSPGNVRKVSR